MALIASDAPRLSNMLKRELWSEQGYCRLAVTVNEASAVDYKIGEVLGKVTASGKYVQYDETAVDGSETAAAIVLQDISIPAATDTTVLVLVKGPAIVADGGLVFKAGVDEAAAKAQIEALGINVDTQI
ncbi:MAG: putative head decoration protein D [Prokaryotic dsDNA virus sp.]|jgi:hypothetical protein|nr:MAG: putative head decoration protein D [Prokaryotic dsDNA virus sp.]|tara:strand:- start:6597 stop:6983 length:387 start_codon:yes stop_codon:yes gene_type:complete